METLAAILNAVLTALALCVLVPNLVFAAQVLAAVFAAKRGAAPAERRPRFAILVPAHNEAGGIGATLASLRLEMQAHDRLLVVADNCEDDTAAVARAQGAEVLVRHDTVRRGKGYALDHGVRGLAADPPEVVVIVDADCTVAAGSLGRLAALSARSGRPAQALYLMLSPAGAGIKVRIAEFAWKVKNEVRALGSLRLGVPCQLTGSGMAFPWAVLQGAPLATGSIVEDLELGLQLARSGTPPLFCPEALVTSTFPETAEGLQAQRTRWEHGHLAVLLGQGPPLFAAGLRQRRWSVAAMALDLCVPPLSSLVMLMVVSLVASLLFGALSGRWASLVPAVVSAALLTAGVLLAWSRFGRHIVGLMELATVPMYILRKVPSYLRFLRRRQTEWVRTRRDDGSRRP